MLEAKSLTIKANGRNLLDDVSATFEPGKVSVILGPNGAGKSTLLSCLAGLQSPTSGAALVDDEVVAGMDVKARARKIGLLPQSADVHWDILARDLVALGRYPYHGLNSLAEDEARMDAAMAATDTTQFVGRNILTLSGGERARVLLARVLAGEPQWLLADEPLANLDPRYQLQLLGQMRALADKGTGVVAVLHDLTQAARVADHIVLMHEGRVFASGAPEELMTPENLRDVFDITCVIMHDAVGQILVIPG